MGYTECDPGPHACDGTHGRKKFGEAVLNNKLKDKSRLLVCLSCIEREATLLALIAAKTPVAAGDVDFLRFRASAVERISRDQCGRLCYNGNVIVLASMYG